MSQNSRVLNLLREHSSSSQYHPLCALFDLCAQPDATIPDQINIHKTIAKYVEAEHKQIEFTGGDGNEPIGLNISIG